MFQILKQTALAYSEDKMSRWAASITFFIVLSLTPLLILCTALLQRVLHTADARSAVFTQLANVVPTDVLPTIDLLLQQSLWSSKGTFGIIISVLIVLFTASGMMVAVQDALHRLWSVRAKQGIKQAFVRHGLALLFVLIITVLMAMLTFGSIVIGTIHSWLQLIFSTSPALIQLGNTLFFIATMTIMFALLIRLLSGVHIELKPVIISAFVITILVYIGQLIIALYLQFATTTLSGVAGSIIVLLLWLYYSAQVFLFGTELTKVLAKHWQLPVVPASGYEFVHTRHIQITKLTSLQKALVSFRTIETLVHIGVKAARLKKKVRRWISRSAK